MIKLNTVGILFGLLLLFACKKDNVDADKTDPVDSTPLPGGNTTWWRPVAGISFDWVLDDITPSNTFSSDVVDVDAFTTTAETVAALHAKGKKVIAYLSVGTFESDRNDGALLPKEVIGKKYDEWPKEKWLDIRQVDKLKPWLNSRFRMIIKKGFDGIEPDNLDSYDNETGFSIGVADTKIYIDYLIKLAHDNGLSIGQKNVNDLASEYADKFDWALTEDAFQQGWQNEMTAYIKLNKPVFATEYTDVTTQKTFQDEYCPKATQLGFTAILKKRDLDKWLYKCQ
ncbi:endo alpha-1,4 polygalactosaminidase [Mucilaginibacter gynuensis]